MPCSACQCNATCAGIFSVAEVLARLNPSAVQPEPEPCSTCSRPMVAVAWLGGRELARYCVACQTRTPPALR